MHRILVNGDDITAEHVQSFSQKYSFNIESPDQIKIKIKKRARHEYDCVFYQADKADHIYETRAIDFVPFEESKKHLDVGQPNPQWIQGTGYTTLFYLTLNARWEIRKMTEKEFALEAFDNNSDKVRIEFIR